MYNFIYKFVITICVADNITFQELKKEKAEKLKRNYVTNFRYIEYIPIGK